MAHKRHSVHDDGATRFHGIKLGSEHRMDRAVDGRQGPIAPRNRRITPPTWPHAGLILGWWISAALLCCGPHQLTVPTRRSAALAMRLW